VTIDVAVPRLRSQGDAAGANEIIRTVTSEAFDPLVLRGEGPIVVEFMSYGCTHSRMIEPILHEVAELMKLEEQAFRVNIGVDPGLMAAYGIAVTPTFVMFLNGEVIGRAERPPPTLPDVLAAVTRPFVDAKTQRAPSR
jgi:thioredoxin-like negative regulator of GroEL